MLFHIRRESVSLDRTFHPQSTPKNAASHRLSKTIGLDMKVCSPTGEPTSGIRNDGQCTVASLDHDPQ